MGTTKDGLAVPDLNPEISRAAVASYQLVAQRRMNQQVQPSGNGGASWSYKIRGRLCSPARFHRELQSL